MDRIELRKVLFKKQKAELIRLWDIFSQKCPHFTDLSELKKITQEKLAYILWSNILSLEKQYPDEKNTCVRILSENIGETSILSHPNILQSHEMLELIKIIPFSPLKTCAYFYEILSQDKNFKQIWNESRLRYGFYSILEINDTELPVEIQDYLFDRLFHKGNKIVPESTLIDFSRFQLDEWEDELKRIMDILDHEVIDIIFSLNLIVKGLIAEMERRKEKISFVHDDLPLLKRVLLAQYLKLNKSGKSCTDEELDYLAGKLNDIYQQQLPDTSIKIFPWSDLE